jgi:hypothetical protein
LQEFGQFTAIKITVTIKKIHLKTEEQPLQESTVTPILLNLQMFEEIY